MTKSYSIYLVRNLVNGKVYVGQTGCSIKIRWRDHRKAALKTALSAAIRKYGEESFEVIEIASGANKAGADALERIWILFLNSNNKHIGYNLTTGGEGTPGRKGSHPQSVESREKIAASHRGMKCSLETRYRLSQIAKERMKNPDYIARLSASARRRGVSPEVIAKMAEVNRGKKFSPERKAKMREGLIRSWTPERREALAERNRKRRGERRPKKEMRNVRLT